jgi:hypothetical protein
MALPIKGDPLMVRNPAMLDNMLDEVKLAAYQAV